MVVENLSVDFNDKKVLNNLSFSVGQESLTAILCPNNCGKTSLIKTLCGINTFKEGKITICDIELSKKSFKKYILNVGVVTEDIDFITDKVEDELEFPLINLAYKKEDILETIKKISKIVKIDNILDKDLSLLSKFEKIKVQIGTSLVHTPKVLLLDDVFRFLKDNEKCELLKILKRIISNFKISILFATSNIGEIINLEHIIVIKDKTKFIEGDFATIINEDNELAKAGFDIPIMIDLSRKLAFYNLVDTIYYDTSEVVNKLWN